jgi:hypothetical protein
MHSELRRKDRHKAGMRENGIVLATRRWLEEAVRSWTKCLRLQLRRQLLEGIPESHAPDERDVPAQHFLIDTVAKTKLVPAHRLDRVNIQA